MWSQVAFPYDTNSTDISIPTPTGKNYYCLRQP